MPRNRIRALVALLTLAAVPLAAQGEARASAAEATLSGRMQGFLDALVEGDLEPVAGFLPRRGEWMRIRTWRGAPSRADRADTLRIAGAETRRVIGAGGAACESFLQPGGEYGPPEGVLMMQAMMNPSGWRRVAGNRFVPPGEDARSAVFVEWGREDGRWVVSAYGEEHHYFPRLLGTPVSMVTRDTVPPAGLAYADGAPWFVENRPITFEGWRYIKYGMPRPLAPGELARIGSLGRMAVYAEPDRTRAPEVLFIPVRPGEYQPYESFRPSGGGVCH